MNCIEYEMNRFALLPI